MDRITQRRSLRRTSRISGPLALLVGAASTATTVIGFAGAPDDARQWLVWLNNLIVLQATLIVVGLALTCVGYRERLHELWQAVAFQRRMMRFKSETSERRAERVRGEVDSLLRRGRWMCASEGGVMSARLYNQWVSHAQRLFDRAIDTDPPERITGEEWIGMLTDRFGAAVHDGRVFARVDQPSDNEIRPPKGMVGVFYLDDPMKILRQIREKVSPDRMLRMD